MIAFIEQLDINYQNGLAPWRTLPLRPCVSRSSTIHLQQNIHTKNNAAMTSRLITPQLAEL